MSCFCDFGLLAPSFVSYRERDERQTTIYWGTSTLIYVILHKKEYREPPGPSKWQSGCVSCLSVCQDGLSIRQELAERLSLTSLNFQQKSLSAIAQSALTLSMTVADDLVTSTVTPLVLPIAS